MEPMNDWDAFLPLLSAHDGKITGGSLYRFKATSLLRESRIRNQTLTLDQISHHLRQSLLLLLSQKSSFSFDTSPSQEVIYHLPGPNTAILLQQEILKQSRIARVKHVLHSRILPLLWFFLKLFIGLFLLLSLSLVILSLLALLLATSSSSSNRTSHRHMWGGRFFSPFRFWYWPYGGGGVGTAHVVRRSIRAPNTMEMSFVESVFSFIFGDEIPAGAFDDEVWQETVRKFLSHRDTRRWKSFEFFPFLKTPPPLAMDQTTGRCTQEEEVHGMASILFRFGGTPVMQHNDGVVEYEFPPVLVPGTGSGKVDMYREPRVIFSLASLSQLKLCVGLGVLNFSLLVLVFVLSNNPVVVERAIQRGGMLAGNALWIVQSLFPWFALYAVLFVSIPSLRYVYVQRKNKHIDIQNGIREEWRRRVPLLLTQAKV